VGANKFKSKPIVATDGERYDLEKSEQFLNNFSNGDHIQLSRMVSPEGEEKEGLAVMHLNWILVASKMLALQRFCRNG
jgi:hypothetical protein